jgi:hypothetical protein
VAHRVGEMCHSVAFDHHRSVHMERRCGEVVKEAHPATKEDRNETDAYAVQDATVEQLLRNPWAAEAMVLSTATFLACCRASSIPLAKTTFLSGRGHPSGTVCETTMTGTPTGWLPPQQLAISPTASPRMPPAPFGTRMSPTSDACASRKADRCKRPWKSTEAASHAHSEVETETGSDVVRGQLRSDLRPFRPMASTATMSV